MMTAKERYREDPVFHAIVDMLRRELRRSEFTPTELREAVILAASDHANPRRGSLARHRHGRPRTMMCFRDRSFCSASVKRCANESCYRFFGPTQQAAADAWWGEKPGASVAFMDFESGCDEVVKTMRMLAPALAGLKCLEPYLNMTLGLARQHDAKKFTDHLPPRYKAGQRCDMLVGPCACGAWHEPEAADEA